MTDVEGGIDELRGLRASLFEVGDSSPQLLDHHGLHADLRFELRDPPVPLVQSTTPHGLPDSAHTMVDWTYARTARFTPEQLRGLKSSTGPAVTRLQIRRW